MTVPPAVGDREPLDSGADHHGVPPRGGRRDAIVPVVEVDGRTDQPVRVRRETYVLPGCFPVHAEPARKPALDRDLEPCPVVLDVEVRMPPPPARSAGPQAIDDRTADRRLHLQRDALVAAPGRRYREPAAGPKGVDDAGQCPVRDAVALFVLDDGGHHQPAAETGECAHDRVREACAGTLAHHDDQRDPVRGAQRAVEAAHLDRLEPPGRFQPHPYRLGQVRAGRIAQRDAGQGDDIGVGQGQVAVDPDLHDRLSRWEGLPCSGDVGLRGFLRGRRSERQRHDRRGQGHRRRPGNGAPRRHGEPAGHGHRSVARGRRRPPVRASR